MIPKELFRKVRQIEITTSRLVTDAFAGQYHSVFKGQGIEFDYCCVHAAYALKDAGYETIMVNCNPETVSTDYDTSDRLYFEPLTAEDVIELIEAEAQNGEVVGVIVQLGGQTPLNLARLFERLRLRWPGRIGRRMRCVAGSSSSISCGSPRVSGPNRKASPAAYSTSS